MSKPPRDYKVGYGRPPKETQWKKRQCGNPKRIRKPKSLDVAKMIEQAFARKVKITEGEETRRDTIFEVIVLQLWTKAAKGSTRAMRVWIRYQQFAASRGGMRGVELRFREQDDKSD